MKENDQKSIFGHIDYCVTRHGNVWSNKSRHIK